MFDKLKEKMTGVGAGALEGHLGTIQELVKQQVGPMVKEIAKDEAKLRVIFKNVYTVLPAPVRLMVGEDKFIEFCLTHKDKVLPAEAA